MFNKQQIKKVHVEQILPNPNQPRSKFNENSLMELAASIREFGVLQPVTLRKVKAGYELIAGERRVRACRMAGVEYVPAIIAEMDHSSSAAMALVENLQREDLSFFDEAEGYSSLITHFGLTQSEVAHKLGKSQSAIANRLRILRLDGRVRSALVNSGLTERHARALLKLDDVELQLEAIAGICGRGLNVKQTEEYVDEIIQAQEHTAAIQAKSQSSALPELSVSPESVSGVAPTTEIGAHSMDLRVFAQSLSRTCDMLRRAGIYTEIAEKDGNGYKEFVVRVAT